MNDFPVFDVTAIPLRHTAKGSKKKKKKKKKLFKKYLSHVVA
jgi:hypothetical protein